jgi:hypothetical protein
VDPESYLKVDYENSAVGRNFGMPAVAAGRQPIGPVAGAGCSLSAGLTATMAA